MKSVLGGIADAFADRNFRIYSIGSVVSWLSFFVQSVAVAWTAWDLTHSTQWLAIVALADAIPNIILMPIGGVVADRVDRFRILLIAYVVATLQAALLAGLAFSGHLTIGLLTVLAALHGTAHAFSIPAAYGLLPRFVDRSRIPSAIGVAAAYTQLGIFAGPALAGWVIQNFGTAVAFATNVAGYGIFFLCAALLKTPDGYRQPRAAAKSFFADMVDGLRAILGNRGILGILALMLFGDMISAALRQMSPAFSAEDLGAGVEGLATLLACGGIGATLSALWLAQGGAHRSSPQNIIGSFLGFLLAATGMMLSKSLTMASIAMIGVGCAFEIFKTGTLALLQISVPDSIRGRVMSTQFLLLRLAGADTFGIRLPILFIAAIALIVWAATFAQRRRIYSAFESNAVPGSPD